MPSVGRAGDDLGGDTSITCALGELEPGQKVDGFAVYDADDDSDEENVVPLSVHSDSWFGTALTECEIRKI